MALKKREKYMVVAIIVLGGVVGGSFLLRGGSVSSLRHRRDELAKAVDEQKKKLEPGKEAASALAAWRKRALPDQIPLAKSLYNRWLSDLAVEQVGLEEAVVTPQAEKPRPPIYTVLPFQVDGEGTLEQLTEFLFAFYSADYLHKIENLTITPSDGGKKLRLTIRIQAMSLPGSVNKTSLPTEPSKRLQHAELAEYEEVILSRKMEKKTAPKDGEDPFRTVKDAAGLFAMYTPPPPPPRVRTPEVVIERPVQVARQPDPFNYAAYTRVTAIVQIDGQPEAWFSIHPTGQKLMLREGDPFQVGLVSGKVTEIRVDQGDVEIETSSGRRRVAIGGALSSNATSVRGGGRQPMAAVP